MASVEDLRDSKSYSDIRVLPDGKTKVVTKAVTETSIGVGIARFMQHQSGTKDTTKLATKNLSFWAEDI